MLDTNALKQLIQQQMEQAVTQQVTDMVSDPGWKNQFEERIIQHIQDRITGKFANSAALPEILEAVQEATRKLFEGGHLPGIAGFVDPVVVKQNVDMAVENLVSTAIQELSVDEKWLSKIENLIDQTMAQRVLTTMASINITALVKQRIDETIESIHRRLFPGIQDTSKTVQLTVIDNNVVVEDTLTANRVEAVESLSVKDLVVRGSINTDNTAWTALSDAIVKRTHDQLSDQWKSTLVAQTSQHIADQGINFSKVKIDGDYVIENGKLSRSVINSSLQSVGTLESLTVKGSADINDTLSVTAKRIGINTQDPEMALTVWDEETALVAGKLREQTAYVGTARRQRLALGVNKKASIEIDEDELVSVKKLQIGVNRIAYETTVPNYSGVKGDIVFNTNINVNDPVFAWICLGGFRWKLLKAQD